MSFLLRVSALCLGLALPATVTAQDQPVMPTPEQLAADPDLFLALAVKLLGWEEPVAPTQIAGPLYFVGTKGLAVFVVDTGAGLILVNTGMPGSGPMIEASITELGLNPLDVKIVLAGHGHIDHVGGHAHIKGLTGAEIVMMEADAGLLESGGTSGFHYGAAKSFVFDPVTVDRQLRDGDRIVLGNIAITALATPGHTRGATTFLFDIVLDGQVLQVAIVDGTGVNPGYHLHDDPSYPGIANDYRATYALLESLTPDIWLPLHNEVGKTLDKIERAKTEGVTVFRDPAGYTAFVRAQRAAFEARLDAELAD